MNRRQEPRLKVTVKLRFWLQIGGIHSGDNELTSCAAGGTQPHNAESEIDTVMSD
jgi:hypothetical protein